MAPTRPLQGLRICDASMGVAGPYATWLMAQSGAEVIKVEPAEGDWGRVIGARFNGVSSAFLTYNSGKKSVALNLKSKAGLAAARRLAATCDVFVESFRPGVIQRLGLDYETLAKARPGLVYLSVSGFGSAGPLAALPAMDPIIQAYSGWYDVNRGADGVPTQMDHVPIDVLTGLYAYQAAMAALLRRFRFGEGAQLEVSLVHAAAAFLAPRLHDHILAGGTPKRDVGIPWGPYPAKEGLITLAVRGDPEFRQLCEAIDAADLCDDERFATRKARGANAALLRDRLVAIFATADAAAWEQRLRAAGVMCCRVRSVGDFLDEAHVAALGLLRQFDQPGIGPTPYIAPPGFSLDPAAMTPAPAIGAHNDEVFAAIALTAEEGKVARG